ncbi:lysophospholipid acyltransferase family protein [Gloeothece verrucosa]|uniref:Phospholipid/glycerol acyltransferase n=1 Tax=Gloeothece verrucosa (strain PCC 7822) TaxID=497965 RepID=E0UB24_GLOV7|nr:lysophospholipid acyltransferase family protein [Gloeothece verrucosa]ADN16269.1 phospholipid/glycerol acyltransferase [Gloeothece verrucosa PCC 7822]
MIHRPGWSLEQRDPKVIESFLPYWDWFYHYYFRVKTDGWQYIPDGKVLLVGSHNGGLAAPDMFMMIDDWFRRFGTERLVYGLMHPKVWLVSPPTGRAMEKLGAIAAHPKMAMAAFERGASVLVYPGGPQDVFRPHWERNKINFAERRGFIKLALREEVPIIPLISYGAHDTLFVLGDCYEQAKQLHEWGIPWLFNLDPEVFPIYLGLPWGLGIGPLPNLPLPVPIYTRVCPPIVFEKYGQKASRNRAYVEACYHQVVEQMQQQLDELVKAIETQTVS